MDKQELYTCTVYTHTSVRKQGCAYRYVWCLPKVKIKIKKERGKKKKNTQPWELKVLFGLAARKSWGGVITVKQCIANKPCWHRDWVELESFCEYVTSEFILCLGKNHKLLMKNKWKYYKNQLDCDHYCYYWIDVGWSGWSHSSRLKLSLSFLKPQGNFP